MRLTAFLGAFGLTAMFAAGAQAQSLACGGEYTVQKGDTLQKITRMAYGERLSWGFLYNANKAVVGPNPSLIEVGMVVKVPCRRGQTPGATASAATPQPASTTATAAAAATTAAVTTTAAAAAPQIDAGSARAGRGTMLRLVTATDYAPFHDQNDPDGGMLTEITAKALASVMEEDQFRIDFINDWSSHLDPLLSDRAYDFGLSWFKPNCDVVDKLGEGSKFRCEKLAFSDPLFEQVVSYFMRADDANKPAIHRDLFGRRVCRPAGYSTFMMEEVDLVEPNITFVTPTGPGDCIELLVEGEVDAVVIATTVADDAIATQGVQDRVEEQPQLAAITTLHAVTSVDNPQKDEQIALMNAGIKNVRESGEWFEIVQRHLIAHSRKTASN